MLDTGDIRLLATIAANGSLVRAGRVLGITQSGVTRALATLEQRVKAQLFDRSRHGLEPTELCRSIIAGGTSILSALDDLNGSVFGLVDGTGGTLAVAACPFSRATCVLSAAARFITLRPAVRLTLDDGPNDGVRALRERRVEVAIAELSDLTAPEEFHIQPLRRHPVLFMVSRGHPLTKLPRPPALEEILNYPFVTVGALPARLALYLAQARDATSDGVSKNSFPAAVIGSVYSAAAVAAESQSVASATAPSADAVVSTGLVELLPFHAPWLVANFGILTLRGRRLSEAAQTFIGLAETADKEAYELLQKVAPNIAASFTEERAVVGGLLAPAMVGSAKSTSVRST